MVTRSDADMYAAGIWRLMASLGMVEAPRLGATPPADAPLCLVGDGDLDVPAVIAPFDGLCEILVGPLDPVAGGQVVAVVTNPITGERTEVTSAGAGIVVLARRGARVTKGDNLVVLAQHETDVA